MPLSDRQRAQLEILHARTKGANHGRARWYKLSREELLTIFRDYEASELTGKEWASAKYGGSPWETIRQAFVRNFPEEYARAAKAKVARANLSEWDSKPDEEIKGYMVEYGQGPKSLIEWSVIKFGEDFHNQLRRQFKKRFPEEYRDIIELKLEASASGSYVKGRQFEWRVRDYYRENGYLVVRSAQSRGPFDLIAVKSGDVRLIQCKTNGKISSKEATELIQLAASIQAVPILAWREPFPPNYELHVDSLPRRDRRLRPIDSQTADDS